MSMFNIKHTIGIAILTFFVGGFYITDRTPYADEYAYLEHANSLYKNQVFGVIDKKTGASIADARYAPLYPAFLAATMFSNKELAESVECYLFQVALEEQDCPNKLYTIKVAQLIIFSVLLAYISYLLLVISSSKVFSYSCIFMILVSGAPFYYADHFLTESLYLAPAFIFLLTLSIGVVQKKIKYIAISAIFLGITALIRPTFLYLFYFLLVISPLLYFLKEKYCHNLRNYLYVAVIFIFGFSIVVVPWLARNQFYFDKFAMTTGYGDKPLATRVAHNEMTNREYLAGWVYWLPDFGDSLAIKWFGTENTKRLSFSDSQSFYPAGRHIVDQKINDAMATGKYKNRIEAIFKVYIFSDLFNHAKITLLLAWRGFFIEKYFGLLGSLVLVWAILTGIRKEQIYYFYIILTPAIILLFFQAAISVSIARYNLILILPMSFAYATLLSKVANLFMRYIKNYV